MALGMLLARNLKRLRESSGFSQEVLAERSGISATQIARLETRKSWISEEAGEKIASALNVDPSELFRDTTPPVGARAELMALIRDADERAVRNILDVMGPMLEKRSIKEKVR